MYPLRNTTKNGFTLIELLVVIAIIGVLASVVLASLNTARVKSRDANRKSQLEEVAKALQLYYADHGTYAVSGGGSHGNGSGWLTYSNNNPSSYPKSVTQVLVEEKYLGGNVVDPSGVKTHSNGRTGYMIAADSQHFTLWANLENPSTDDQNTLNSCPKSNYDGYHGSYPAAERMNYCIGY